MYYRSIIVKRLVDLQKRRLLLPLLGIVAAITLGTVLFNMDQAPVHAQSEDQILPLPGIPGEEAQIDFSLFPDTLPQSQQNVLLTQFNNQRSRIPSATSTDYVVTAYRQEGNWSEVALVPRYVIDGGWEGRWSLSEIQFVVMRQDAADQYTVIMPDQQRSFSVSGVIPKSFLDLPEAELQAQPRALNHLFPWSNGRKWALTTHWHATADSRLIPDGAIDFAPTQGDRAVLASEAGTVRYACTGDPSQGFLIIDHDDGTRTGYLHLAKSSYKVANGQRVAQGKHLADIYGNFGQPFNTPCGRGTGPHIHYHFWTKDGKSIIDGHKISSLYVGGVYTSHNGAPVATGFNRTAAYNWAYANRTGSNYPQSQYSMAAFIGGAWKAGGFSSPSVDWMTQAQIVQWLAINTSRWDYSSADKMRVGDLILHSCYADALKDPLKIHPQGNSWFDDATLVINENPKRMAGWALPSWNNPFTHYEQYNCPGTNLPIKYRVYIHIKTSDDPKPQVTNTPTKEPTVTLTPTNTPTKTPPPVITREVLVNGGFENGAFGWKETASATRDKVKCNKPGKTFAHIGNCAYLLKGTSPSEVSKIKQVIKPSVNATSLNFSGAAQLKSGNLSVSVTIKYANGMKAKVPLAITNGGYNTYNMPAAINGAVAQYVVNVQLKGSGKAFVDTMSLKLTSPAAGSFSALDVTPVSPEAQDGDLLPLPPVGN